MKIMENREPQTLITRRRAIKGAAVATAAAVVGGGSIIHGSQPAIAAHMVAWNASDIIDANRVQADDGTLTAVNIAPGIDIDWQNFANGADSADVTVTAHLRAAANAHITTDKSDVVYDATGITSSTAGTNGVIDVVTGGTGSDAPLDGTNTNGGVTINLNAIDLTDTFNADASGETEDITEADFADPDSSTANRITTVELELATTVNGAQSANPTANVIATYDVEVENLTETQSTGGTANTSAQ